jgi:hypothetical protein
MPKAKQDASPLAYIVEEKAGGIFKIYTEEWRLMAFFTFWVIQGSI